MATIGLRDLYRAPITVGEEGKETYGTPVRMAKAISAELSVEVAEASLYADDGVDEAAKEFVSGELTLNVNDLPPAELAALLGQTQDEDKVVYAGESDEPPYMANDTAPVWEDITAAVLAAHVHVFKNQTDYALQHGFNIRVTVERKSDLGECWIGGIGGNFE